VASDSFAAFIFSVSEAASSAGNDLSILEPIDVRSARASAFAFSSFI
jgi:hypothetical protein